MLALPVSLLTYSELISTIYFRFNTVAVISKLILVWVMNAKYLVSTGKFFQSCISLLLCLRTPLNAIRYNEQESTHTAYFLEGQISGKCVIYFTVSLCAIAATLLLVSSS